uniref:Uncharacterized protein n=1 Tax=Pseudomonas syringae pv. actinidiae TaxID=103796 RepID=A0A286JZZ9_PSESF|nr:hypothetical protein [Pseudomonas syringae pv. actinidiae]
MAALKPRVGQIAADDDYYRYQYHYYFGLAANISLSTHKDLT